MNKRLALLCSSNSSGGLELNTARLAKWLQERGWQITIYGLNHSPLSSMAHGDKIHFSPINPPKKYLAIKGAISLSGKLKKEGIGVLMVCTNRDLSLGAWTKFFSGKNFRLIYQQHMQVGIKKKDLIHTLRYSAIDRWLAPADYLAKEVVSKTRFDANKIRIVPFGIETNQFFPSAFTKLQARELLQLPVDKKLIGIIGRLDPQKGQHLLIEALQKLKHYKEVHLLIMGDTTQGEHAGYGSRLHDLAKKFQLSDRIHFRPFTKQVQVAFAAIDIFVMASRDETYGMVTIEAMASGVPVIGSNAGGTIELLDNGKLGLLFIPENPEDLAEKIEWILTNKERSEAMTLAAQTNVLKNYSHTRECELIEEVIDGL